MNEIPTLESLKEETFPFFPNTSVIKVCQIVEDEVPKIAEKIRGAFREGKNEVIYSGYEEKCPSTFILTTVSRTFCEILENKGYKAEINYSNHLMYNGIKISWN